MYARIFEPRLRKQLEIEGKRRSVAVEQKEERKTKGQLFIISESAEKVVKIGTQYIFIELEKAFDSIKRD